jgi:hypothetical protein
MTHIAKDYLLSDWLGILALGGTDLRSFSMRLLQQRSGRIQMVAVFRDPEDDFPLEDQRSVGLA